MFYGNIVAGPRLPNLTYMICFNSLGLNETESGMRFACRRSGRRVLSGNPRYAEDIVSNITITLLRLPGQSFSQ